MRKLSMNELNRVSRQEFKGLAKLPVVCVLDNVRSQHNIGSVFRTADAFRIEKMVLCGITATPPNREIQKTALGATESIDWEYFPETKEALLKLKQLGYSLIAVEQAEGSISLEEYSPASGEKIALIFGNEVEGVSDDAMKMADSCIEIPQFGTKHSFNISITAGIVLWNIYLGMKSCLV